MGIWPADAPATLSFTFDDAVPSQLDVLIPLLDRFGVKATFYVSPGSFLARATDWIAAHREGHEIGNHTATHPCSGNFSFAAHNALEDYTIERMAEELDRASEIIAGVIGAPPRTFAYPCGQTFVGRGESVRSYIPLVAERFLAGRGYNAESHNLPDRCDLAQLMASGTDGAGFEELRAQIDRAERDGGWLILVGHGVDSGHHLLTRSEVVEQTVLYAKERGLSIDTVERIATHLRNEEPILG